MEGIPSWMPSYRRVIFCFKFHFHNLFWHAEQDWLKLCTVSGYLVKIALSSQIWASQKPRILKKVTRNCSHSILPSNVYRTCQEWIFLGYCWHARAISSFNQYIHNGKLVFPEWVADAHILFPSSEWYKCVSAQGALPAQSDPKTRRQMRPGSF